MDLSAKHSDGHRDDHDEDVVGIYSVEDEVVEDDDYDDDVDGDGTKSLLPAGENGMLRSFDKGARKVQWNDSIGNNLAEVLEFMPSESSENGENGDEDSNNCLCIVM